MYKNIPSTTQTYNAGQAPLIRRAEFPGTNAYKKASSKTSCKSEPLEKIANREVIKTKKAIVHICAYLRERKILLPSDHDITATENSVKNEKAHRLEA